MKSTYLTIALAMGMAAAPVMAAGAAWDNAVALSAHDSDATLADLCNAVYKAAKESPAEADKLYEVVLTQRTNWKAGECYAILRSIMLAMPDDVACNVGEYTRKYQDAKGSAVEGQKVQRARYSATIASATMMEKVYYGLLDALYNASLADGVADATVNMFLPTLNGVYETSFHAAATNDEGRLDTNGMMNGVMVTPPPTSPNN